MCHFHMKHWIQSKVGKIRLNLQILTLFKKKNIPYYKSLPKKQVLQFSVAED